MTPMAGCRDTGAAVDVAAAADPGEGLPGIMMSGIMSDMAPSITVRELQKDLKRVLARVERGQTLQVTRRRRPVALLAPARPTTIAAWPDLDARARAVLGDRIIAPAGSALVIDERGDR